MNINNERIVTDADLSKALDWLRDSAKDMGNAKEALIVSGHMLKHTEAILQKASEATSDAKRLVDARTDKRWLEAALADAKAAGAFEQLRSLREAAAAKIEAWRSEQANYRSMKI